MSTFLLHEYVSRDVFYQALPRFSYCKQQKLGKGLGTRLERSTPLDKGTAITTNGEPTVPVHSPRHQGSGTLRGRDVVGLPQLLVCDRGRCIVTG